MEKTISELIKAHKKPFWLSVKKKGDGLFSRRLGIQGVVVFGYSIRMR